MLVEEASQELRTDPTHAPPPTPRQRPIPMDATVGPFFQVRLDFLGESPDRRTGEPRHGEEVRDQAEATIS